MKHTTVLTSCVALLLLAAVGCSRPYVNIPSQRGDLAAHDPNANNVRNAAVTALRAVMLDRPIEGPVLIKLPAGTSSLTYAAVAPQVSEYALTPQDDGAAAAGLPTLEVRQIRIRGWDGEVDIIRPTYDGGEQLITVTIKYAPFSGWTASYIRTWRGNVDQTLPSSALEPAPTQTP